MLVAMLCTKNEQNGIEEIINVYHGFEDELHFERWRQYLEAEWNMTDHTDVTWVLRYADSYRALI